MTSGLNSVFGDSDFIDDWMFLSPSALQISNAMLRSFLLNRGLLEYTERDGVVYDVDYRSDRGDYDLRRTYFTMMNQELDNHHRFGLLIVSPFAQQGNDDVPKTLSCHCLTIYSGCPKRSAKQLLKAIHKFKYSPDWSFLRRGRRRVSFSVPIRFVVFEIDNYWKGTQQGVDLRIVKKAWLRNVARNLETHYIKSTTFSFRLYLLSKYTMQFFGAELMASCRPLIRPIVYRGEEFDDLSCSDSSDLE